MHRAGQMLLIQILKTHVFGKNFDILSKESRHKYQTLLQEFMDTP